MIGNEGDGFKIAMQGLNGGRINIGKYSHQFIMFIMYKTHNLKTTVQHVNHTLSMMRVNIIIVYKQH